MQPAAAPGDDLRVQLSLVVRLEAPQEALLGGLIVVGGLAELGPLVAEHAGGQADVHAGDAGVHAEDPLDPPYVRKDVNLLDLKNWAMLYLKFATHAFTMMYFSKSATEGNTYV